MTFIDDKDCCGCMACYNICPKNSIDIKMDEEGFEIPVIDPSKCIKCGACERVCPVINKKFEISINPVCYALALKDSQKLYDSTSGGAFVLFAEHILKEGGCVVGASMDSYFKVRHVICWTIDELKTLKKSKYVQSSVGDIYREIKKLLEGNIKVLFSGTPCQVEALKSFLHKDYDHLYTIDILCHGVPADVVFQKYIHDHDENVKKVRQICFKGKKRGWRYWDMEIASKEGNIEDIPFELDSYCQMYLCNLNHRYSCYRCRFRNAFSKVSDATIGDYWGIEMIDPKFEKDKGTSLVLIHTDKMKELFEATKEKCNYIKTSVFEGIAGNIGALGRNIEIPAARENYYHELRENGYRATAEKYYTDMFVQNRPPRNGKEKIKQTFPVLMKQYDKLKFKKRVKFVREHYEEWMREEFSTL